MKQLPTIIMCNLLSELGMDARRIYITDEGTLVYALALSL